MQDRIKQMAVEAGFSVASSDDVTYDPYATSEVLLARFARLVAEDCAAMVDGADTPDGWSNSHISEAISARYAETKEVK